MIKLLTLNDFRGVTQATLEFPSPLTVLVGRNGSGKSTVLDALLVGASPSPGDAIGRAVVRRSSRQSTAQWLFNRRGNAAHVSVTNDSMEGPRQTDLKWLDKTYMQILESTSRASRGTQSPAQNWIGGIEARTRWKGETISTLVTAFATPSWYDVQTEKFDRESVSRSTVDVRLVDMRSSANTIDLTQVWTEASEQGRVQLATELLSECVPGFKSLAIMAVGDGFELGLEADDGMAPLSMAGDGIRSLVRLSLELAARRHGLVLLEEPEVHQHPAAIRQSASAIVGAMRRGLQVVVATHSLELIDWLLIKARDSGVLGKLSVQRLRLARGQLESNAFSGEEANEIRLVVDTELRG